MLFRLAEIIGRTRDELVATLTQDEFAGWIEYIRYKDELQEKAMAEAREKARR